MLKDKGEDYRWNRDRPVTQDDFNKTNTIAIFAGPLLTMYKTITCRELNVLMERGEDIVILDVRSPGEYNRVHICGALNIPLRSIEELSPGLLRKDDLVIVYCDERRSLESAVGADKLTTLSFENVLRFEGGLIEWVEAGFCTEGTMELRAA